jgi:hypothetical protein
MPGKGLPGPLPPTTMPQPSCGGLSRQKMCADQRRLCPSILKNKDHVSCCFDFLLIVFSLFGRTLRTDSPPSSAVSLSM